MLVEYRQLRKANAFIDRRFGEDNESLTAEEKAIARFQKQRMKDLGGVHACCLYIAAPSDVALKNCLTLCKCTVAGDKFALNNGQEESEHLLTHMGQLLGEDDAGQVHTELHCFVANAQTRSH